jgi:hypothetical protein
MTKLTYFRQQRVDGGIRTGITIDMEVILHHFQRGKKEADPVVVWSIDVRCAGAKLPEEAETIRQWFLDKAPVVREALTGLAAEMKAGIDFDGWPYLWPVPHPPRGVRMTIACSASRLDVGRRMAELLTETADGLEESLRQLKDLSAVPR